MRLVCSNCGAPLKVAEDQTVVTCGYCQAVTRIPSPGQKQRPGAPSSGAPQARIVVWVTVAGLLVTGVIVALVAQSRSRQAVAPAPAASRAEMDRPAPGSAFAEARAAMARDQAARAASQGKVTAPDAGPAQDLADASLPAADGARTKRAAGREAPVPAGPVSSKQEAAQVLEPEVLSCMKQHGVHYLITRLGNKRRGGSVPPLGLTGTSVVDYKPTPGFASTPLGRCVARAASAVRAPAYGGDYIYFGLRNDSVADPLAGAPARLDAAAAKQALSALDDEARDCAARSPAGSRPGESVSIMVGFQGATGQVSDVRPYYVDKKSPYGRCLSSVYGKATVGKFREIDSKIVHVLKP